MILPTTKDNRKEMERKVNAALEEIHDKGFTTKRAERYQMLQLEWWKECDRMDMKWKNQRYN